MLFRETITGLLWEPHGTHNYILCGQNEEYFNIKADGRYIYHLALKG
jgi:hypothetical protein